MLVLSVALSHLSCFRRPFIRWQLDLKLTKQVHILQTVFSAQISLLQRHPFQA